MIVDALKKKNNNLALYQGFLLITLTKNLKIQYSNLGQLLMIRESDKKKKCVRTEGGRRRKSRIEHNRSLEEAHLGQEDRVCGREGISSGRGC